MTLDILAAVLAAAFIAANVTALRLLCRGRT